MNCETLPYNKEANCNHIVAKEPLSPAEIQKYQAMHDVVKNLYRLVKYDTYYGLGENFLDFVEQEMGEKWVDFCTYNEKLIHYTSGEYVEKLVSDGNFKKADDFVAKVTPKLDKLDKGRVRFSYERAMVDWLIKNGELQKAFSAASKEDNLFMRSEMYGKLILNSDEKNKKKLYKRLEKEALNNDKQFDTGDVIGRGIDNLVKTAWMIGDKEQAENFLNILGESIDRVVEYVEPDYDCSGWYPRRGASCNIGSAWFGMGKEDEAEKWFVLSESKKEDIELKKPRCLAEWGTVNAQDIIDRLDNLEKIHGSLKDADLTGILYVWKHRLDCGSLQDEYLKLWNYVKEKSYGSADKFRNNERYGEYSTMSGYAVEIGDYEAAKVFREKLMDMAPDHCDYTSEIRVFQSRIMEEKGDTLSRDKLLEQAWEHLGISKNHESNTSYLKSVLEEWDRIGNLPRIRKAIDQLESVYIRDRKDDIYSSNYFLSSIKNIVFRYSVKDFASRYGSFRDQEIDFKKLGERVEKGNRELGDYAFSLITKKQELEDYLLPMSGDNRDLARVKLAVLRNEQGVESEIPKLDLMGEVLTKNIGLEGPQKREIVMTICNFFAKFTKRGELYKHPTINYSITNEQAKELTDTAKKIINRVKEGGDWLVEGTPAQREDELRLIKMMAELNIPEGNEAIFQIMCKKDLPYLYMKEITKMLFENDYLNELLSKGISAENLNVMIGARENVERFIVESKSDTWINGADKLLAALVNPRNGDISSLPLLIAREGMRITDERKIQVLGEIFQTRTMQKSGFEREAFLDGMIFLNSKENGFEAMESLLNAYRGSRKDPSRVRRIFQMMQTLDRHGERYFEVPDCEKAQTLEKAIDEMKKEYEEKDDKSEKKIIKDNIERLESDLKDLTGLKGIEDHLEGLVVRASCKKLDLTAEYEDKLKGNLDEVMRIGLMDVVPVLVARYESKKQNNVRQVLQKITSHIVEGDFKQWRYSHEQSEKQLSGLNEAEKEFWKKPMEPVTVGMEISVDEKTKRKEELRLVRGILRNAKEHILVTQPDFDFSEGRLYKLNTESLLLTNKLKLASDISEKKELGQAKRKNLHEAALVKGFLEIEKANPDSFVKDEVLSWADEIYVKLGELKMPMAQMDIEQIQKVFTTGDTKKVTAYESDDPMTLFRIGVEPQETCQSWRNGLYNECLLAYVADSNKKVVNVENENGKVIARSVIKYTKQRKQGDYTQNAVRKTILIEKPYEIISNKEVDRAFIRLVLQKAQGIDSSVTFRGSMDQDTKKVYEDEAEKYGYKLKQKMVEVFVPQSMNPYEYSDVLGGKISRFQRYISLNGYTFEKTKKRLKDIKENTYE